MYLYDLIIVLPARIFVYVLPAHLSYRICDSKSLYRYLYDNSASHDYKIYHYKINNSMIVQPLGIATVVPGSPTATPAPSDYDSARLVHIANESTTDFEQIRIIGPAGDNTVRRSVMIPPSGQIVLRKLSEERLISFGPGQGRAVKVGFTN